MPFGRLAASELFPEFAATLRPEAVVGSGEGLVGAAREDKVGDLGAADGAMIGSGIRVDLAAETQGGLADLRTGPHVTEDSRIEFSVADDDGIIADRGLAGGFAHHERGKDDEGVGGSDEEIPTFELIDSCFHIDALLG